MNVISNVSGKTKVFGIIGNPIEHSFSPILQNTIAKALGMDMIYTAFEVEVGQVKTAIDGGFALNIQGFNVTVPHKIEVLSSLKEIDKMAECIGAVNTLKRIDNGYKGYNTDILGLGSCFNLEGISLENKTVVILGAGGAANGAAVLAASNAAKEIIIVNRTKEKAKNIALQVEKYYNIIPKVIGYDEIMDIDFPEIVIQTTSVGMGEGNYQSPVENLEFFNKVKVLMEVIYTPWETKLLKDAKAKGCKTINGFDMLVYQGIKAFEIWHEIEISSQMAKEIRNTMTNYYKSR